MRTQHRIQLTRKISTRFHCFFGQREREVRLHATAISRTVTNSGWKNVVVLSISASEMEKGEEIWSKKCVGAKNIERISLVLSRRQIYLVSVYFTTPQNRRSTWKRRDINWTPKKGTPPRYTLLLRITILIPLDPSTRLVGLFDF